MCIIERVNNKSNEKLISRAVRARSANKVRSNSLSSLCVNWYLWLCSLCVRVLPSDIFIRSDGSVTTNHPVMWHRIAIPLPYHEWEFVAQKPIRKHVLRSLMPFSSHSFIRKIVFSLSFFCVCASIGMLLLEHKWYYQISNKRSDIGHTISLMFEPVLYVILYEWMRGVRIEVYLIFDKRLHNGKMTECCTLRHTQHISATNGSFEHLEAKKKSSRICILLLLLLSLWTCCESRRVWVKKAAAAVGEQKTNRDLLKCLTVCIWTCGHDTRHHRRNLYQLFH